jgi:transcriptional regulator with XRE-family HTH domain
MTLEQEPDPLRRIPTKHTSALRAEIGPILRAARLKRGQSLEAVAQQTRISKRFLEALEENRFEQFPAVVYLRGFLKGYCEHLDVNFDEIWAMLNSVPTEAPAEGAAPSAADVPTAHVPAGKHDATHARPSKQKDHGRAPKAHADHGHEEPSHGSGATGAIVLAVLLAVGLAVFLFKDHGAKTAPPAPSAPAALQPMPRSIEPKLTVRLKSDAWLRVSVDGQVAFEGRAPRDSVQEWKPAHFVDIRTTEPSALELVLNGQPVTLGAPGTDGQYRVEIP